MYKYILNDITSIVVFTIGAILIVGIFYVRNKLITKKLGDIVISVTFYSKNIRIARYILLAFLIILIISIILVLIFVNDTNLFVRLLGQVVFLVALNLGMSYYSTILFCKDGFAGAGLPKTFWNEVKGVIWDKDIGQKQWGAKIFIHGKKRPFRAFFKRENKIELEKVFSEFISGNKK